MPIRNAGGPKALTEVGFGYEHIMSQLRFLIREVDIKVIAPMWHVDCRAYGKGHRQLPTEAQHEYYEREMALVKQELSAFGLPVEPVIVHFDGIHIF
jgi:primosomal protein N''